MLNPSEVPPPPWRLEQQARSGLGPYERATNGREATSAVLLLFGPDELCFLLGLRSLKEWFDAGLCSEVVTGVAASGVTFARHFTMTLSVKYLTHAISWKHTIHTLVLTIIIRTLIQRYTPQIFTSSRRCTLSTSKSTWQSNIVQVLCESRGGRPGLSVLTNLLVSVDVKL